MRTTLDIDDTVLAAARALAQSRGGSLGHAVSELARRGMAAERPRIDSTYSPFPVVIGIEGSVVTDELVAELRDA